MTQPRNQVDPSKKRYCNILVRCGEHGWECPDLKREAQTHSMKQFLFDEMRCFHYHISRGFNFMNFKDKLSGCRCEFNYYPLPRGIKKNSIQGNRRRDASDSRSRSRSNSSSPLRQAGTQGVIVYRPDEAQRQAISEGRFASLEAGMRDYKKHKTATNVELKNLKDTITKLEKAWNKSNNNMQSVFADILKREDLPEENADLQETESVLTFGRAASPAVDDPEPESIRFVVNPPNIVIPPWFNGNQSQPE